MLAGRRGCVLRGCEHVAFSGAATRVDVPHSELIAAPGVARADLIPPKLTRLQRRAALLKVRARPSRPSSVTHPLPMRTPDSPALPHAACVVQSQWAKTDEALDVAPEEVKMVESLLEKQQVRRTLLTSPQTPLSPDPHPLRPLIAAAFPIHHRCRCSAAPTP